MPPSIKLRKCMNKQITIVPAVIRAITRPTRNLIEQPIEDGRSSFFFQAEDGIRDLTVTGVQTCALPISSSAGKINPLLPAELVIDHSVQVDEYGTPHALSLNASIEFQRNKERYAFLRWGQSAFRSFAVVPPDTGIVHQVNLEFLARVIFTAQDDETPGKGMAR